MTAARRVAVIEVDLESSRRGLSSCLEQELLGKPVLQHTVERLQRAESVEQVVLMVHEREAAAARELVPTPNVDWFVHSHDDIEDRSRVRRARRWGKEGWSGGVAGTYFTCETGNPFAHQELCEQRGLERVLVVPADAALVDPDLVDEVVASDEERPENRIYLSTTSPGLAADVFHIDTFRELARRRRSLASLMKRNFSDDSTVWEQKNVFHPFREEVSLFRGRFTVDSRASLALFRELLEGDVPDTRTLAGLWQSRPDVVAGVTPEELIVEVVSMPEEVWGAIVESFAQRDDALLTLVGGEQDVLADSRLVERVREARAAGAFGIHVQSDGCGFTAEGAEELLGSGVDVITVDLGLGRDEERHGGLARLLEARGENAEPFVAIAHELSEKNMYDWEPVWDRWYEATDAIGVWSPEGPRGEEAPGSLGLFTPPQRFACLRLVSQMLVTATGEVPLCRRDPALETPMGRLPIESVADVWQGEAFRAARAAHRDRRWADVGHCADCHSWCRFD